VALVDQIANLPGMIAQDQQQSQLFDQQMQTGQLNQQLKGLQLKSAIDEDKMQGEYTDYISTEEFKGMEPTDQFKSISVRFPGMAKQAAPVYEFLRRAKKDEIEEVDRESKLTTNRLLGIMELEDPQKKVNAYLAMMQEANMNGANISQDVNPRNIDQILRKSIAEYGVVNALTKRALGAEKQTFKTVKKHLGDGTYQSMRVYDDGREETYGQPITQKKSAPRIPTSKQIKEVAADLGENEDFGDVENMSDLSRFVAARANEIVSTDKVNYDEALDRAKNEALGMIEKEKESGLWSFIPGDQGEKRFVKGKKKASYKDAESVRDAVRGGKISREEGLRILREEMGYE